MTDNNKRYPSDLAERFQIRMPKGLRDRIAAAAKDNNRSMNSEIIDTLEKKYPIPRDDEALEVVRRLIALYPEGKTIKKNRHLETFVSLMKEFDNLYPYASQFEISDKMKLFMSIVLNEGKQRSPNKEDDK